MAAAENQVRAHLEFVAVGIFPGDRGVHVHNFSGDQRTSAELGRFLEIVNGQLIKGLALIVAVVQIGDFLRGNFDFRIFPGARNLFPVFHAAGLGITEIGGHALGIVGTDPCAGTEPFIQGKHAEAGARQLGDAGDAYEAGEMIEPLDLFGHVLEVLVDWNIVAEMEIVLQDVAVGIPLAVEVAVDKPVRFEYEFGGVVTHSDGVEQFILKLVESNLIFWAGADVVETAVELVREIVRADVCHESGRVLYGGPLQNLVQRNMEHDGVHIFQNGRVQNSGLAKRDPLFETGFGEDAL